MGNHEYCEKCGESSFHLGRPCDPKKKAAVAAHNKQIQDNLQRRHQAVERLIQKLNQLGIPCDERTEYRYIGLDSWPDDGWDEVMKRIQKLHV